jgi:hypothetical protein
MITMAGNHWPKIVRKAKEFKEIGLITNLPGILLLQRTGLRRNKSEDHCVRKIARIIQL